MLRMFNYSDMIIRDTSWLMALCAGRSGQLATGLQGMPRYARLQCYAPIGHNEDSGC